MLWRFFMKSAYFVKKNGIKFVIGIVLSAQNCLKLIAAGVELLVARVMRVEVGVC